MKNAPVILFAFNRLDSLKNTVSSLLDNDEAAESDLYIFVDGARSNVPGEAVKVDKVKQYVKSITGFNKIEYVFAEKNNGLGNSIIQGVSRIINEYGRVIVLEDDLVTAPNFLAFMNTGLTRYENEKQVFSVCGYSNKVKIPAGYSEDAYFCTRSSSWGWGTWADRWNTVDWELKEWQEYKKSRRAFNKWGGSDCFRMLRSVKEGPGNSWAIRFGFAQFLQNKLSLFPITSKVRNDGFDGLGTNCKKWSRFRFDFDQTGKKIFKLPTTVYLNKKLYRSAMSYHTIPIRIYSKLMYFIYR